MFDEEFKKLNELKKQILFMRDSKEKVLLINDYYSIALFLEKMGAIEDIKDYYLDSHDEEKYDLIWHKERINLIKNVFSNMDDLYHVFANLIDCYHENNFYGTGNFEVIIVDKAKMGSILDDFFYELGDDIYALFARVIEERRLLVMEDLGSGGYTYNSMHTDLGYIIVPHQANDLNFYLNMVHEFGHLYEMKEEKDNPFIADIHFLCEVVSTLFEKLFIYYLDNLGIYEKEVVRLRETRHAFILNHLAVSKFLCELRSIQGGLEIDGDELIAKVPFSKDEITSILENDCGFVFDRSKKLPIYSIIYAVNDIISTYFFYEILCNKEKGFKELKDFITNMRDIKVHDLINNYLMDSIKDYAYIEDFICQKEKQNRKSLHE